MSDGTHPDSLVPFGYLEERTSLSRTSIYRRIKAGNFPAPAKLGYASRWSKNEIDAWMQSRLAARA